MNSTLIKVLTLIVLVILIFLALSSGMTKVTMMQQDVDFFGKYGFTNSILIGYGALQIIGGVLLIFRQTRFVGAVIVAVTFVISLIVLLLEGNIPVSIATALATLALLIVMKLSWRDKARAKWLLHGKSVH